MKTTATHHSDQKLQASPTGATAEPSTRRPRRFVAVTAAVYVASWLTGLVIAPTTPVATASADTIRDYYASDGLQILLQSSLIHGLAGVALVALALVLPAATRSTPALSRTIRRSGFAAAMVSLFQAGFAAIAVASAASASAGMSERLFDALNRADTAKLFLLSVFVTAATVAASRASVVGRWTRGLTAALAVALPIGGLAFVVDHTVLTAVLYASLPMLLTWAGIIAWRFGRVRAA